ncbi:molecular chaperone DnaJ [candidate division KSB1 bacterium]|nr:molecular chaperone DnaJ [candidate division KSB1 bacterium]
MSGKDYYEILGVGRQADAGEIKRAYRKLAMQYHPDKNPNDKGAEDKFKELGEAYSVLSDPQKRTQYDQFGHVGGNSGGFGGFNPGAGFDPFDIFREVFGGGFGDIFGMGGSAGRRSARGRGNDLQIKLRLSYEEIAAGVKKKIKIRKQMVCESCGGTGSAPGASMTTCTTCRGAGEVAYRQGFFSVSRTCPQCQGQGEIIEHPCKKCHGEGRIRGESTVEVDMPAGVSNGQYLTIRGAGNIGLRGGAAGDVIVLVEEEPHRYFERHGDDILYELHLSFAQAALGDEVEVPTLKGKAKISIPPGTQNGKLLRMRGKGITHLNTGGAGDQLVRVNVFVPTKLGEQEKRLLKELAESECMQPPRGEKGFFERVKEAFV